MSTTTKHKRTRIIALVTALLVVAGILGIAPKAAKAVDETGTLTVEKTLVGATDDVKITDDDKKTEFEFTLDLTVPKDATLPKTLTYTTGDNKEATAEVTQKTGSATEGTCTFKLKGDESATFALADGSSVKVAEKLSDEQGKVWTAAATVQLGNEAARDMKADESIAIAVKNPAVVTFTNTKAEEPTEETGNLTVSKEIKSDSGAELSDELKATKFSFTIDLENAEGKALNGTYKYSVVDTETKKTEETKEVSNGGTITLKGGQEAQIVGIPVDTRCTVEEADVANWTANSKKLTGTISKDKTATAAFTNTYAAPTPTPTPTGTGSLKISKKVSLPKTDEAIKEAAGDTTTLEKLENRVKQAQGEKFTFTVNLLDKDGKAVEGEFDYTGTEAGKETTGKIKNGGTVTLAHDDAITVAGLPEGTAYTVTENAADNWQVDEASKKGTISSNGISDASFTNTALGALKISKTIKSASGAELSDDLKATEFTFTVTFTENDQDVAGEFTYTGSKEGSIKSGDTITLKGGESVTFTNLKVGMKARVAETQVANWQASARALSGEIIEYSARTASFTNTYQDVTSSSSGTTYTSTPSTTSRTTSSGGTTTTSTRSTTPATADGTNAAAPLALGVLALGLVAAGRVSRSKE